MIGCDFCDLYFCEDVTVIILKESWTLWLCFTGTWGSPDPILRTTAIHKFS